MFTDYTSATITLPSGSTNEVKAYVINLPKGVPIAQIISIQYVISTATNSITATFKLYDSNGVLMYSKGSIPYNATTLDPPNTSQNAAVITFNPLLVEGGQISFTPSGDPGTSGMTCYAIFRVMLDRS